MAIPINQKKVDAINAKINPGQELINQEKIINPPTNPMPEIKQPPLSLQDQLKSKIASGQATATDNYAYNLATGNNQGAREVMLGSSQAMNNSGVNTTVTPEETAKIAQAGITNVGEGVKPDMTAGTKEDFKQAIGNVEKTTVETPEGTTVTTKETPVGEIKIDSIEGFKKAGGGLSNLEQLVENRYGTVATQNPDGSLTATIGDEKFQWTLDASGNPIKQSLGKVGADEIEAQKYDPNVLFSQIQSGVQVSQDIKNSEEYKNQLIRNDNLMRYEKKSAPELSKDIINGKLIAGSQVYNDLKLKNPQLITDAENLAKLNGVLTKDEGNLVQNTQIGISDIIKQMLAPSDIPKAEDMLSKDEEINTWNTELGDTERQMKEKKRALQTLKKDVEKELEGTGATRGYINSIISERSEQLTNDYNNLLDDYTVTANKLERKTNAITADINYKKELQADENKKLELAYGIMSDETNYQRGLEAETRQFNRSLYTQELQNQYQDSKDIQNYEQDLQKMGIQNAMAIDMNNLNFDQQKQLTAIQQKYNQSQDVMNYNQDIAKMKYSSDLGTQEMMNKYALENPTQQVASGQLQTYKYGNKNITLDSNAGAYLQNVLSQIPSTIVGSTLRTTEEQKKLHDAYLAGTGGRANAPGTSLHEKGLAVDIYSGTDKNGKLLKPSEEQIKVMNENGWYQTAGKNDLGHFEFKGVQGGQQYSKIAEDWANNIINGKAKLSDLTGAKNIDLKNQVISVMNEKSGGKGGEVAQRINESLELVNSLINHPGRTSTTGVPSVFTNPLGYSLPASDARDFKAEVERLKAQNFLNGIQQMKGFGALTEAEGAKVSASVSKLQELGISDKAYLDELNRLKKIFEEKKNLLEGTPTVDTTGTSTQYGGKVYNFKP